MKSNLSLTSKPAQCCANSVSKKSHSPFALLVRSQSDKPLRITLPAISARPVLRGDHRYLRALRAAEMAAWNAGKKMIVVLIAMVICSLSAFAEKSAYWQIDANGQWADSSRWSTPGFPDNSGTNLYSATFDMTTRTVTLDRNITIESFNLLRGALEGTNAPTLWLNQQFHWDGTKLTGGGTLSANGMTISNGTKIVRGWLMENRGVANWLNGDLHLGDGARFYNSPVAGFNANFDGTILNDLGGTALFENAGTFRKSAGTNQTKIYIPFLNTGTVEVDQGELAFFGNSTNIGGIVQVLNGAKLQFTGQRHAFDASSKLAGDGVVEFDNGTVDFDGIADLQGPVVMGIGTLNITPAATVTQLGNSMRLPRSGTLNLNSGKNISWNSLTISNGYLSGSDEVHVGAGGFLWTGGTIKGSGEIYLDGNSIFTFGSKTLRGWLMENHGAIQWNGGDVSVGEGARFLNLAGGSVQTSFDGVWSLASGGASFFGNYGAFQKSGGTNFTAFSLPVYNEGLIYSAVGAIRFSNGLTNNGALSVQAGAAFNFSSTSVQLNALGSLDGDGEVLVDSGLVIDSGSFRAGAGVTFKGGSLRFTNTTSRPNFGAQIKFNNSGTLDLNSGYTVGVPQIFQTNGLISGSDTLVVSNLWICSNGDLDGAGRFELRGDSLINGGPRWTGRRVVNYGQLNWASGDIEAGLGLFLHNDISGVFGLTCDRNFTGSYGGNTTFLNEGTFRKDASGTNGFGTSTLLIPFINNGSVAINSGRVQFNGGFTQTNGSLAVNGTAVGSTKPFLVYGGMIAGQGDIFGTVSNAGVMVPGWGNSIGQLKITGNCTQAVSAVLQIELGETNHFDTLAVTGQANLNGKLAITALPGYTPKAGDTFPILTCGSRVGQFSEITGTNLSNGLKLTPVYQATGVSLTVVSTEPPAPVLSIESFPQTGGIKVSWPADATGWNLQSSTNFSGTNWITLPQSETNFVVLPANPPAQFFRLFKSSNQP